MSGRSCLKMFHGGMTANPSSRVDPAGIAAPGREDLLLLALGGLAIVAGGLVAAVTGPLSLDHGSWLAAYLVLVGGVASVAVGAAQTWLVTTRASGGASVAQVLAWVVGNIGVVVGSLTGSSAVVIVGGALLVVSLVIALTAALRVRHRALGWAYRAVLAVVAVSIPVGLVLSVIRNA